MKVSSHCTIGQGDALYFLNSGTNWLVQIASWLFLGEQRKRILLLLWKMTDPQLTVQVKECPAIPRGDVNQDPNLQSISS
jgi:type II secretory pathway component PulL